MAWPGILREIISFTLQDCNADMNLLSVWSRKLLIQIPKMPLINLTEELKAQLHKYRDELSWLGSSYSTAACTLLGQSVNSTHTHPPFCIPLFVNTLSSLWKGWEGSSLELGLNHISTLMSLKIVKAFPWSSDYALLSQLAVVIFEWCSVGFPVPNCPCTGWEMELVHFNIRHEKATKSEIQCFTSSEGKLMSCEKLS